MKSVSVKAQTSDRQARHIAEGLSNGNVENTKAITQNLQKSQGGQGIVDLQSHVASDAYNSPEQRRRELNEKRKQIDAERSKSAEAQLRREERVKAKKAAQEHKR